MSSSNFLHDHQPAISPYSPSPRNPFLHRYPIKATRKTKKKLALISLLLYIVRVKFSGKEKNKKYTLFLLINQVYVKLLASIATSIIGKDGDLREIDNTKISLQGLTKILLSKNKKLEFFVQKILLSINDNLLPIITNNILSSRIALLVWTSKKYINDGNGIGQGLQWHGRQIENVLLYWFGQYSPEQAQKHLWMISSSSKEQLEKVDTEIYERFASLLVELATNDQIRRTWCGGLNDNTNNIITTYDNDDGDVEYQLFGWRGMIAAIIVLDQMSRHIHRYKTSHDENISSNIIPSQSELDTLALNISKHFQQQHQVEISNGMIPTPMLIFALMPHRHASTIQTVGYVKVKVEELSKMNSVDLENMIRRFRRATNRRMAALQDDARKAGQNTFYNDNDDINGLSTQDTDNGEEVEIISKRPKEYTDDDILEFQPFTADMTTANKHPIVKTIIDFLCARGIKRVQNKNIKSNNDSVVARDTPIIVSLSGGVDSMVIANALAFLRDHCDYDHLYLSAVHIDYGNRPESTAEANFVYEYATNGLGFDECIVRRIDEVTRGETKRDEYEKVSRNVRYDLYRNTISKCIQICTSNNPLCVINEVGVMLGHHRGDIIENVISNSNKGCGPLDLSGMTDVGKNDGVTVYRPLLPLDKEDVYGYSHQYGVPYFNDTTPHWSTRGKLRNKLIPLLEEVYGDGCLGNLAKLAQESDEARDLFNKSAFRPFLDAVVHYPMGVIFSTAPFKSQGFYFWKIVLRDLLHSVGLGMFSDKSIESFLDRASVDIVREGWLQCRKDFAVYLMKDGRVMVLVSLCFNLQFYQQHALFSHSIDIKIPYSKYPKFFPWRKSEAFKIEHRGESISFHVFSIFRCN